MLLVCNFFNDLYMFIKHTVAVPVCTYINGYLDPYNGILNIFFTFLCQAYKKPNNSFVSFHCAVSYSYLTTEKNMYLKDP